MNEAGLRAAAERVVASYDQMEALMGGLISPEFAGPLDVAVEVSRAWLAEHPADDAGPVTVEWLKSVGFENSFNPHWLWLQHPGGRIAVAVRPSDFALHICDVTADYDDVTLPFPATTRRQVRLLCDALGVPLKG